MTKLVTNPLSLRCPRANCNSKILDINGATLVRRQERVKFPEIGMKLDEPLAPPPEIITELLVSENADEGSGNNWYWLVADMMAFYNIGILRTTEDGHKYLSCADCDLAPLGYHDTESADKEYLVAVDRVSYS